MKTKSLTIKTLMYSDHISPPSSFIELGRNLKKLKDNYVDQMIQNFRVRTWLDEEVVFSNCPKLFVTLVSDHFRDNTDITYVITYSFRNDGIAFSLRNRKGFSTLPYTFLISKKGEGHECASGAFLTYKGFEREIKQLIKCSQNGCTLPELKRNLNICQDCRCCVQEIKEIYNKSKSNK